MIKRMKMSVEKEMEKNIRWSQGRWEINYDKGL